MMELARLTGILHSEGCSCVIGRAGSDDSVTLCHERGVSDLLRLLDSEEAPLRGAMVADKVVGKGAAVLMAAGGVLAVHADVISRPALELLHAARVSVEYDRLVDNIINRAGTGLCPVESLCIGCATPEECLPLIRDFVNNLKRNNN